MIGTYLRYTDEKHADIALDFPALWPIIIKPTYEEAEREAIVGVVRKLIDMKLESPIRWYFHQHTENSDDPLDCVGSHGWKTVV